MEVSTECRMNGDHVPQCGTVGVMCIVVQQTLIQFFPKLCVVGSQYLERVGRRIRDSRSSLDV